MFGFFKKAKEKDYVKPKQLVKREIVLPNNRLSELNEYDPNKKTILIMDDFEGIISIVLDDFDIISKIYGLDIKTDFNILCSTGNFAAFDVMNFLDKSSKKIDFAILDITLGGMDVRDNEIIELDGVDVAFKLQDRNPDFKVLFCTGHNITKKNPNVREIMVKWEQKTNSSLSKYTVLKTSDRVPDFYNLLK